MYTAGFYTYSIFALMFWETRRKDFGVSMSHHIATVVLIVLSYILRYVVNELYCIAFDLYTLNHKKGKLVNRNYKKTEIKGKYMGVF